MHLRWILPSCLVLTLACGDDGGGGGTTASSSTGPASTGPGSTGPGSTGTTAGSGSGSVTTTTATEDPTAASGDTTAMTGDTTAATGQTSATTDASTGGSTTGGMGSLDAGVVFLEVYQDCMPIVPPDPVNASFTLSLTNTGDVAASATVTSAAFLDAGGAQVATLDVTPDMFGPIAAGDSSMTMVTKVSSSLVPANGCEVLGCGQIYTLELELDVDGVEVVASDVAMVGCVF